MNLSDFDFVLPAAQIATEPLPDRAASRMLVVHVREGRWEDREFRELPRFLRAGDCLVLNDTRVFPARLPGHREGFTGEVEVLMTRALPGDGNTWLCLVHPGRKVRTGDHVVFGEGLRAEVLGRNEHGERIVRFEASGGDLMREVERVGHVPLPPYVGRPDSPKDRERYQTVYAGMERGSAAAPTAGLHFTPGVLADCQAAGAGIACITLHVGLGTFQPIRTEKLENVRLHAEWFRIGEEAAARIAAAKRRVAVGTTVTRVLETAVHRRGGFHAMQGDTDLFIAPGFEFKAADAVLTNFHLPKSSLFVLVCARMGRGLAMAAYRHAIESGYRFYSYGDCMLIL
jgi:S-adenosylmethionine:tRNA ribosyltransferase-isomerase